MKRNKDQYNYIYYYKIAATHIESQGQNEDITASWIVHPHSVLLEVVPLPSAITLMAKAAMESDSKQHQCSRWEVLLQSHPSTTLHSIDPFQKCEPSRRYFDNHPSTLLFRHTLRACTGHKGFSAFSVNSAWLAQRTALA